MQFWRSGTDSEGDDKDKEGNEWEKRDCSVLSPVASGTVDTGEGVGVNRWGIVATAPATHLTSSLELPTHHVIQFTRGIYSYTYFECVSVPVTGIEAWSNKNLIAVSNAIAFVE